uniref:Uncharacterized protein LOC111105802 isoform X2 n=1 Tax=Crassostrea virginica TaxID=6565 RepID=A0A8B8AXK3_CRAVI|nr:uncharacterized protein LOC111105802 isoform X2 [Crassostrea virginica]
MAECAGTETETSPHGTDTSSSPAKKPIHTKGNVIIFAMDGSDIAINALKSPNTEDIDAFQTIFRHEIEKIQKKLQTFAKILRQLEINGSVRSTHASKPGEGIINVAKELNACMIVTGSRGHGKIRRTLLGSVSDYLIHHADIPVLVCRHQSC